MVIARRFLIRESEVGLFHIIGRCVRKSWLCGEDPLTGNNYEHRKEWIKNRFHRVAGRVETLINSAQLQGKKWLAGKSKAKTAFN